MGPIRQFLNRTVVPRSLYVRSLIILIVPIVVLQLVIAIIFYNRHLDSVTRSLSLNVAANVAYLSEQLAGQSDRDVRQQTVGQANELLDLNVDLISVPSFEPGRLGILPRSPLRHIDDKIIEAFEQTITLPFLIDLRPNDPAVIEVIVGLEDQAVRYLIPKRKITAESAILLLGWMLITALIVISVAVYYLKLQVRPIRRLAKAMSNFGKGRDAGDFAPEGPIEVRRAAQAFNRMRRRIVRHINQRTELLAAVSHDLRTPLTRMRLGLEMLGDTDDETRQGLQNDVGEMGELVDLYLSFARGEGVENVADVRLAPLIQEIAEKYLSDDAKISCKLDRSINAPIRQLSFKRCLANIVENAVSYGSITVITLHKLEDQIEIIVEDNGPGVPIDQREAILQPFVTFDVAKRKDKSGVGLGLAIAHDIVLGHGGELELANSMLGGLAVKVRLPN